MAGTPCTTSPPCGSACPELQLHLPISRVGWIDERSWGSSRRNCAHHVVLDSQCHMKAEEHLSGDEEQPMRESRARAERRDARPPGPSAGSQDPSHWRSGRPSGHRERLESRFKRSLLIFSSDAACTTPILSKAVTQHVRFPWLARVE